MSPRQWHTTLGINLDSVFGLVQSAVAQMQSQPHTTGPRGHIVLVASTAAQRGEAFHADYAASKGALVSLTKSLSSELIASGIYCNCVAPGWVRHRGTSPPLPSTTPRNVQKSDVYHPPRPPPARRPAGRPHPLPMHPPPRLHLRRKLQRKRRSGPNPAKEIGSAH